MVSIIRKKFTAIEMQLKQSQDFNSSLLDNSPSPITVINADGSIRYINPALEKLTGFTSEEVVGCNPPYPWWREGTQQEFTKKLLRAMRLGTRRRASTRPNHRESLYESTALVGVARRSVDAAVPGRDLWLGRVRAGA